MYKMVLLSTVSWSHWIRQKGLVSINIYGFRHIMMGYLNREDKTREDLDEEGWMHSGDLGRVDSEGFLSITGKHISSL